MIQPKSLHHVQICIPAGREEEAKSFYLRVLGWKEIEKPDVLKANGGFWLQAGPIEWHIGVEPARVIQSKRHVAFEAEDLDKAKEYLRKHHVRVQEEKTIPGINRFSFYDPFGNRIECVEPIEKPLKESLVEPLHETKKAVIAQFSESAQNYVTSAVHAKGKDLQMLINSIDYIPTMNALDIATGGGHVANALATRIESVTALDLTPEILKQAEAFIRKNGHDHVSFVQGDAEQLPFQDAQFNLVTCRIAPHHFPNIPSFVEECYRVLKAGGQFALIDNVAPENEQLDQFYNAIEKRRDYSHNRAWKKTEWLSILEEIGFRVEQLQVFSKMIEFKNWCERMHVSDEEQKALSSYILSQTATHQSYFNISEKNGVVDTFTIDSILVKAAKR